MSETLTISESLSPSGCFSDIFSFYKEELAGEKTNYVHDRAAVTVKNPSEAVLDTVDDVAAGLERVRAVLEGDARDVLETHISGFTYFHFVTARYGVKKFMGVETEEYLKVKESK